MAYKKEYMELAISLAKKGIGAVNPNPLVGAVIVKDDKIIGQGYHARYGELHAERAAFANLTEDAEGAELYVTLEPCCHFGKQPPCTQAIVEHKIKKVYVGSDDPNEMVAGKGISFLREHGIEVETGVMKDACDAINPVFFHYITKKTPYVVMKYAMTLDGKIATYTGKSKWITADAARMRVQECRNAYMGIMAGIGTVLADNPQLTCRLPEGRNPIRIVCDSHLRIPEDCTLVQTAKEVQTIVAVLAASLQEQKEKAERLQKSGITFLVCNEDEKHVDLQDLMQKLGAYGIDSILLEGSGTLNYSALQKDIVQELQVYIAPKLFGGADAKTAVEGHGVESPDEAFHFQLADMEQIGEDLLLRYVR